MNNIKTFTIPSSTPGLNLSINASLPSSKPKGIIQISHGMNEYKEKYHDFLKFLSDNGYVAVIHDHRGHGDSIKQNDKRGYFYDETGSAITIDLYLITKYLKNEFPNIPIHLFCHSMGSLVGLNYLKDYSNEITTIALTGVPTYNRDVKLGLNYTKIMSLIHGSKHIDKRIDNIVNKPFQKNFKDEEHPKAWVASNWDKQDLNNPKTNFTFTLNGYKNLFNLMHNAYSGKGWHIKNKNLPILLAAGTNDPVTNGKEKLIEVKKYLTNMGYKNITLEMFKNRRHELLFDINNKEVYNYYLEFIK